MVMKIKKFNENNNWSDQLLRDSIKTNNYIIKNLLKFLKYSLSKEDFENLQITKDIYSMWYAENWHTKPTMGEYFGINFHDKNGEDGDLTMTKKDYNEFIQFLNDPELYMSSKKYNL